MTTHNYFAYGSNLNAQDWQRWCREENEPYRPLKRRCVAYLPDHELAFTFKSKKREGGVLDIRSRIGQAVTGVVFEIDDAQLAIINRKEGAPTSYRQIKTVVLDDNGQEIPVVTYQVVEQRWLAFVPPSGAYVEVVRAGLQDHDLPDDMLDAAAANQSPSLHTDGLFAYGTLLRGECRFEHLASFGLLCSLLARAFGRLVDLGSYPGLIDLGDDSSLVAGDFFRVKDVESAIKSLDRIEGFAGFGQPDSLFRRTLVSVDVGEGRIRRAWTYVYAGDTNNNLIIPSGNWREHRGTWQSFLASLVREHTAGDVEHAVQLIAQTIPFSFAEDRQGVVSQFMPLDQAMGRGDVSERKLAQVSGNWTARTSD